MKKFSRFLDWLVDYRTVIPLVFWFFLLVMDWIAGGDYTNLFTRAGNIGILVVWGFMAWLFTGGLTDATFLPGDDQDWEDLWKSGHQLPVSIILAGRFVFAGLIAGSLINPF